MEDNEFEEVTIISHTDHGTSVLPQSTAERLMKEIKLEVTQKISQNENVKLGSLEGSTTPTLLDAIHQKVLRPNVESPKLYFFAALPKLDPPSDIAYFCASYKHLLTLDRDLQQIKFSVSAKSSTSISFVQVWGPYLFVFSVWEAV